VVLCLLQIFTSLVDKPLNFSLKNVKETILYSMVSSFLLQTIFNYDFLYGSVHGITTWSTLVIYKWCFDGINWCPFHSTLSWRCSTFGSWTQNITVIIFSSLQRWIPFMLSLVWREFLQNKENILNLAL
jgi:hypothetical protein